MAKPAHLKALVVSLLLCVMAFIYASRFATEARIELRIIMQAYKTRNNNRFFESNTKAEEPKQRIEWGHEETQGSGIYSTVRHLKPFGLAAYFFVQVGAYRGGSNTFSIVGLASKPLHVYSNSTFQCKWVPATNSSSSIAAIEAKKFLPDWGYGRIYTVVVLSCKFEQEIGTDALGGQLLIHGKQGKGVGVEMPVNFVALEEKAGDYNAEDFQPPYPYDYLHCGSPLYGYLNPQRIREWIAYHAKFFGPRSHFVFHDAGGIDPDVEKILEPWVKAGRVTIQNYREEEKYDGYLHNQFLILNDCMLRYKFKANWTFFFDVDEYVYVPPDTTLEQVLAEYENYTQVIFEQAHMSGSMCLEEDEETVSRQWGFEKLVFRDVKTVFKDRKYAMKSASAETAGVHLSEHIGGNKIYTKGFKLRYYHYRGTPTNRRTQSCSKYISLAKKEETIWHDNISYVYDDSMRNVAASAKEYEMEQIGMANWA